jgi:hypothetical protein
MLRLAGTYPSAEPCAGASLCQDVPEMQARWPDDSAFTMLPGVDGDAAARLAAAADGGGGTLPALLRALRERPADAQKVLRKALGNQVCPSDTEPVGRQAAHEVGQCVVRRMLQCVAVVWGQGAQIRNHSGCFATVQAADEVIQVCGRLPLVDVRWQQPRPAPAPHGAEDDAEAEEAMLLSVELRRLPKLGGSRGGGSQTRVYAPCFPKV